jgi:protein-tyrosine-phosphatase
MAPGGDLDLRSVDPGLLSLNVRVYSNPPWLGQTVITRSAGSEPAERTNPVAVRAMAEEGIDIAADQPKILTTDAVKASDVVITMGCGDTCPTIPANATRTGC